jgi:DNA-binding MarR family transcriptional regulator
LYFLQNPHTCQNTLRIFDFFLKTKYTFIVKRLASDNISSSNKKHSKQVQPIDCSARLIEVVPLIMKRIRGELRSRTMPGLNVPQFRTLTYLRRHPEASLSDVAGHLGLTPPTVSKMIQKLVEQEIIMRHTSSDRRRVCLSLSEEGIAALKKAREETLRQLAENLKTLSEEELTTLSSALEVLGRVFLRNETNVNVS